MIDPLFIKFVQQKQTGIFVMKPTAHA